MSTPDHSQSQRDRLLGELGRAGRDLSDAIVLFHSVLAEKLGLGPSDWKTLGLLERYGPLSAGELSARSGLAPASVTGIIDRLERGGWVHRRRDAADGRRVVVEMDRVATAAQMDAFFGGLMRRLADVYSQYGDDELELLLGLLRAIARCQAEAAAELSGGS